MIGVDYDLFWTLNPKSLTPFIKAFHLKYEYDDKVAWTNGLYVRIAVASLFDAKNKYPDKPLSEKTEVVDTDMKRERMMNKIKQNVMQNMMMVNNKFAREGDKK